MKTFEVIRNLTNIECPWLPENVNKGDIVYEFGGCTYGCIEEGVAVSKEKDKSPFFEVPWNAVRERN